MCSRQLRKESAAPVVNDYPCVRQKHACFDNSRKVVFLSYSSNDWKDQTTKKIVTRGPRPVHVLLYR